jgi:hypothetical protein
MAFTRPEWRPTRKQEIFLSLPLTIKEGFYGGGAGSAKTDVLLVYPIAWGWHEQPGFKQVLMRRTFPELRNEVIPRSRQLYTKFGATLNKGDMAWTFPAPDQFGGRGLSNAGAMIFLGQCEDEDDVHKYDSMEINLYSPDELPSLTEFIYIYIGMTRVRTSDPNLPAIIRAAGMPGGVGHRFVKKRFVDPSPPPKDRTIIIGRGGVKRIYVHATLADNPHIDPAYKASLEAIPNEAERKAKLHGDWDAYVGQVFDEFRDRAWPNEPTNALHVIDDFGIPSWWPKILIGDWGFAAMCWLGFGAISPDKRLYIYRELHWIKTKINEWAPVVKEIIDKEAPRKIKFCKSAGQERGQEQTIQQQISEALGQDVELTSNNPGSRVAGKQLIHEYLRWTPKPVPVRTLDMKYSEEHAMWLLRNRDMKEYNSYMQTFIPPEPEYNLPKLQIFKSCPVLIDAIKACSYDKKKVEDIAEFEGDDPIDGLRYLVDSAEQYFEIAAEEFRRIQKQEEILRKLAENSDYTAFYRNMKTVESSDPYAPVSLYHRRAR